MIFINRHHVFHMQRSTLIPHQAGLFFSASRHYNNAVILIYIWGTVMVDITKQNWQNIPIVLWKGRLSPTLTLREKKKKKEKKRHSSHLGLHRSGNSTFPHSILWLFITPDGRALAHRKWSVSATGRGEGGRSDPQHVNQAFFFMSPGHPGRWSALVVRENSGAVHMS